MHVSFTHMHLFLHPYITESSNRIQDRIYQMRALSGKCILVGSLLYVSKQIGP